MSKDDQLLDAFRRGERVKCDDSLFPAQIDAGPHQCRGRVIVCTDDRDVFECGTCGKQWEGRCTFDDDYA